jgi:hypothetical protein
MKSLIATTLVALGLLTTAIAAAQADSEFNGHPEWAQRAFEPKS